MSEWPARAIGEVCDIVGGGTPSRSNEAFFGGGIPWATVRDMKSDWIDSTEFSITAEAVRKSATNILPPGTVVVASRVGLGKACRIRNDTAINQDLRGFLPKKPGEIDEQYLFPWFTSIAHSIVSAGTGATVQGVTLPFLRSLKIPLPPLEEQRRVVAVLDEAFAAIATATANAGKNLANARELFRSELTSVIAKGGKEWRELPLGTFCEIYQPQTIGKADMIDGGPYPVFGANGIIGKYHRFNHAEPQLLVTCRGATCGSLNISAPNSWVTGNAMVVRPKDGALRLKLLMRIFEGAFDFSKVITGAAQPQITRQSFAPAKVKFPTRPEEQAHLEAMFDELQTETDAMAAVYFAKQAALASLKQSLLQKAFAGELTQTALETFAA